MAPAQRDGRNRQLTSSIGRQAPSFIPASSIMRSGHPSSSVSSLPPSRSRSRLSQPGSHGSSPAISQRSRSRSPSSTPRLPSQPDYRSRRPSLGPPSSHGSQLPQPHPHNHRSSTPWPDQPQSVGDDHDAVNEVILALNIGKNGTVGCAYYLGLDETLKIQEDVPMAGVGLVETLLLHIQPTTIIIPSQSSDALVDYLEKGAQDLEGSNREGGLHGAYVLRHAAKSNFKYETGKTKLLNLNLDLKNPQTMILSTAADDVLEEVVEGGEAAAHTRSKLMQLSSSINLDSQYSIGCAGALLSDIERRQTAEFLPNDPDMRFAFRVRSLEMFALADSMFVNADAFIALQILRSESHPNSQMQGPDRWTSAAKESLSVYGLFHFLASTPQGSSKLRQLFLRPSIDLDVIRERHQTIALLLRPDNREFVDQLRKTLKKIVNIRTSLAHLRRGVHLPSGRVSVNKGVWATIQRFAAYILELGETLRQVPHGDSSATISKTLEEIKPREIVHVGELISQTVDFQESESGRRTAVVQGVSAELDEMKRHYHGLEHFLDKVAMQLIVEIPEWARGYIVNCIFYPQLGFLTVVKLNPETGKSSYEGEGIEGDVWEEMFVDEGSIYYKNRRMRELDKDIGDLYCMISDKEIEIVHDLGVKILEHEDMLITASDVCGDFDCLLALALGADMWNLKAPTMTSANVINIEGGRHPLQELAVPSFIANDCQLASGVGAGDEGETTLETNETSPETPSMMILTGPNHSGKSVYLKQVALTIYMAQIGSFVPAERAVIGVTDKLLTRIATRESVSRNESAFSTDLSQAAFSINFATRRSLILIDEFGKGTNATDGAALMTALLDYFLHMDDEKRPKVLAATHFHEIFENNYLETSKNLAFAHMDIRVDFDAEDTEDQVTFLYQLRPGRSISSFGSRCAAMNGVDAAVVERAEAIVLLLARGEDLEAACAKLSDDETAKLQEAESIARDFLELDIDEPTPGNRSLQSNTHTSVGHGLRDMLRSILGESPEGS